MDDAGAQPEEFWNDDVRVDDAEVVVSLDDAVLSVIASAQYSRRLGQVIEESENDPKEGRRLPLVDRARVATPWTWDDPDRAQRYDEACRVVLAQSESRLREVYGEKLGELNLDQDHTPLLHGRFTRDRTLALLISATLGNPIRPFEIKATDQEKAVALHRFAADLGAAANHADIVLTAVEEASAKPMAGIGTWVTRGAAVLVGVALVVAAPYLVAIAAPAGVAGAAALVAGLAALGPGGMVGGLAIVGAVGAGGGGLAASSLALTSGSRASVQENLVFLDALVRAQHSLSPFAKAFDAVNLLNEMQDRLCEELAQQQSISDKRSSVVKDAKQKAEDIKRVLTGLRDIGIENAAPKACEEGDDD